RCGVGDGRVRGARRADAGSERRAGRGGGAGFGTQERAVRHALARAPTAAGRERGRGRGGVDDGRGRRVQARAATRCGGRSVSEVLPLRGVLPIREPGLPRELSFHDDGPTPLRRPFSVRRRKKSGVASLLAGAALRALLVVALPVGVVVWLLYSPYFLIREVKVDGGARVSAAWMQENLQPLVGRHVLAVSLDAVRRRLSAHPWVASVELRRELPDRLRVSVVERQPVALLAAKEG